MDDLKAHAQGNLGGSPEKAHADSPSHSHHAHPHPDDEGHSSIQGHIGHVHTDHTHQAPKGVLQWLMAILHLGPAGHGHDHGMAGSILETSARGIWAIKISFVGLMITAILQVIIVYVSGSVALLADTIHNFGDASTAIPLWIAFSLSRRPPTRRYTYGLGRAEDLAGVAVVALILFSAGVAGYEAIGRIIHPRQLAHLEWVAAAGVIGFIGNEAVAIFRTRVGRQIGSAALIADGQHARVDGLTSLAVLAGAIGVWLGFPLADPIIGLLITLAILRIAWGATRSMWYRMMDASEPEVMERVEKVVRQVPGVRGIHGLRSRWVGHQMRGEVHIEVDPQISVSDGHEIAELADHALHQTLPRLAEITIHLDPSGRSPAHSNAHAHEHDHGKQLQAADELQSGSPPHVEHAPAGYEGEMISPTEDLPSVQVRPGVWKRTPWCDPQVLSVEEWTIEAGVALGGHSHGACQLIYIAKGKLNLRQGGRDVTLGEGSYYYTPAGVTHHITEVQERTTMVIVGPPDTHHHPDAQNHPHHS